MKEAAIKHIPDMRVANKAELAEFFGISAPTVGHWLGKGMPYTQKGDRGISWQFDLLEVAEWKFSGADDKAKEETDPEKMEPKHRLDWYKGDRERDIHAKEQDRLIPFELSEALIGAAFSEVRAALLAQHNTIATEYPEIPNGAIKGILDSNRELLAGLAQTQLPGSISEALDKLVIAADPSAGQDSEPVG